MRRKNKLEAYLHCSVCLFKPHFFLYFSTWQTSSLWQSPAHWTDGEPQASSVIRVLTLPLPRKGANKQSHHLFSYSQKYKGVCSHLSLLKMKMIASSTLILFPVKHTGNVCMNRCIIKIHRMTSRDKNL